MNRTPTTPSGRPLDIYPHGRAAARDVLHDVHHLASRSPLADTITAAARQHSRGNHALAHAVEADTVFLIAHAADPTIRHPLDGRLPSLLHRLDREEPAQLGALIAQAQQAATSLPVLTPRTTSPSSRLGTADRNSWLHDNELRELLGAAVHTGLELAELRYTGRDGPDGWKPGTVTIAEAFAEVAAEMCTQARLDPRHWQPFVEVQMAHAVAGANELPLDAGLLDDRIPAYMADLMRLEAITVADTLYIAHADFGNVLHDPPETGTSPRALVARSRRPAASAPHSTPAAVSAGARPLTRHR
ncbi:hypothetical protein [Peterkaempfera bronchialis]|uniref:hypothetical protein n=1 Tax=Peterkaempfera bronchialis TaxID=2126346 RepID=UPI003C2E1D1A